MAMHLKHPASKPFCPACGFNFIDHVDHQVTPEDMNHWNAQPNKCYPGVVCTGFNEDGSAILRHWRRDPQFIVRTEHPKAVPQQPLVAPQARPILEIPRDIIAKLKQQIPLSQE